MEAVVQLSRMRSHTTGPRGKIHLSEGVSLNSITISNSLTGWRTDVCDAVESGSSCAELDEEARLAVLLPSAQEFAKAWIRSPRVFNWSGFALPAAAN